MLIQQENVPVVAVLAVAAVAAAVLKEGPDLGYVAAPFL